MSSSIPTCVRMRMHVVCLLQLVSHFELGNASGRHLPKDIFQKSTTIADFLEKHVKKVRQPRGWGMTGVGGV